MLLARTDMDDATLRDELLTLLVAGHETTATALAWALERLAHHPRRVGAPRASGDEDYLDAVSRRRCGCGRSSPPSSGCSRPRSRSPATTSPAGVAVVPNILLMHTREDVYPDPFAFRPERFLEQPRRHLHVDPVRRRRAPLPRRELRAVRDEGRAARRRRKRSSALAPAGASERPSRRAVTLVPAADGQVIVARRAAPARREPPVPTGR